MKKALVVVNGSGLAGTGTITQCLESYSGWVQLSAEDLRLLTAWDSNPILPYRRPDFHFSLGGLSFSERHKTAKIFAEKTVTSLRKERIEKIIMYSFGYTSFVPWAFANIENVTVVWGDCSPPDTDFLGEDTTSRFFKEGYRKTHGILYGWHEALPSCRVPECLASYNLTAQPFSDQYVRYLRNLRGSFPVDGKDSFLACICSSDIWSPTAIGKWMTEKQWDGVVLATRNLFSALNIFAERLRKKIKVVFHHSALKVLNEMSYPWIEISPLSLPQNQYHSLLKEADLVICRASHSVTSAECAAMGVPQIILPMPADGYMNVEDFTNDVRRRGLAAVPESSTIESIIASMDSIMERGEVFAQAAAREFDRVHREFNFFSRVREIIVRS